MFILATFTSGNAPMGDHILGNLGSLTTIYRVKNDGFELAKNNFSGGFPLFIEIDTIFNKIDLTF